MDKKNVITVSIEYLGMQELEPGPGYTPPAKVRRMVEVDGVEVYAETMTAWTYYNKNGNPAIYAVEGWVRDAQQLAHKSPSREDRPAKRKKFISRVQMLFRKVIS